MRKIAALNQPDPETGEIKAAESYSGWENEFLGEVEQRLGKYGSAFHDLSKGRKDDPLSMLQAVKLREIAAKARGKKTKDGEEKPRGSFKQRKPLRARRPERPRRDDAEE